MALLIWLFYELGGGKFEVPYAYNGECSSICDTICDRTGVAPGVVLWGRGRGTLEWVKETNLALVIWVFFFELGGCKVEVSFAYNGQCSSICDAISDRTGVAPGIVLWGRGRGP